MAKNPGRTLVTSWSTRKLPLGRQREAGSGSSLSAFPERKADRQAEVEKLFGAVEYVELPGMDEFCIRNAGDERGGVREEGRTARRRSSYDPHGYVIKDVTVAKAA